MDNRYIQIPIYQVFRQNVLNGSATYEMALNLYLLNQHDPSILGFAYFVSSISSTIAAWLKKCCRWRKISITTSRASALMNADHECSANSI